MRPIRSVLVSAATAVAATVAAAMPAAAAPPVGCYGLPSVPAAFVCVTEFTPGEAVPGPSVVTVPAVCAGDCYGPFTIGVPGGGSGSGRVAVVTYNGKTYEVIVGELPDLSGYVPPITFDDCPGTPVLPSRDTSPYLCVSRDPGSGVFADMSVGTCLTLGCTVVDIPVRQIAIAVACVVQGRCP